MKGGVNQGSPPKGPQSGANQSLKSGANGNPLEPSKTEGPVLVPLGEPSKDASLASLNPSSTGKNGLGASGEVLPEVKTIQPEGGQNAQTLNVIGRSFTATIGDKNKNGSTVVKVKPDPKTVLSGGSRKKKKSLKGGRRRR